MQPRIVKKETFKLVGLELITTPKENQDKQTIGQLWKQFNPICSTIPNRISPDAAIGLCRHIDTSFDENTNFSYIAGVEVSGFEAIPEGLATRIVPEGTYAVFTHKGPVSELAKTYNYIYSEWLPSSQYELAAHDDFEYYDSRFNNSENSEMDIYIPLNDI